MQVTSCASRLSVRTDNGSLTQSAVSQLAVCTKWLAAVPLRAHLAPLMLSLIVFPPNKKIRC